MILKLCDNKGTCLSLVPRKLIKRSLSWAVWGVEGSWQKMEMWVRQSHCYSNICSHIVNVFSTISTEENSDISLSSVLLAVDGLQLWFWPVGNLHKSLHSLQKEYSESAMWGRCESTTSEAFGIQVSSAVNLWTFTVFTDCIYREVTN